MCQFARRDIEGHKDHRPGLQREQARRVGIDRTEEQPADGHRKDRHRQRDDQPEGEHGVVQLLRHASVGLQVGRMEPEEQRRHHARDDDRQHIGRLNQPRRRGILTQLGL